MPTADAPALAELSDYEKERGKPRPRLNHAVVQFRLGVAFSAYPDFSVLPELALELPGGQRLTPDISVLVKTPVNWLHDIIRVKTMPLLAVEISSPTQGFQEIADKIELYFAHGVKSVWVVQPAMQAIAIYRQGPRVRRFLPLVKSRTP